MSYSIVLILAGLGGCAAVAVVIAAAVVWLVVVQPGKPAAPS